MSNILQTPIIVPTPEEIGYFTRVLPGSYNVTNGELWLFGGLAFAIGFIMALIMVLIIYGLYKRRSNVRSQPDKPA